MAEQVSESGHWYDPASGEPRYTYTNKKGEIKNTTLRQARVNGWVPSVTTIISHASAPALVEWKINQHILSALTATRGTDETEADFVSRIKSDAKEQAKKAAERGTQIHAWVQSALERKEVPEEALLFAESVKRTLMKEIMECDTIYGEDSEEEWVKMLDFWICEQSFATNKYGGKADMHNPRYLIDIKTKTWDDKDKLAIWDTHIMQLAAYRQGLNIPEAKCGILYVHQDTAESVLLWADEDKLKQGLEMFQGLLDFYYAKTKLGRE